MEEPQSNNIQQQAVYCDKDEVSFFELFRILFNHKKKIIGITLSSIIVSILYTLFLPNLYQVEATYRPPLARDIQELQVRLRIASRKLDNFDETMGLGKASSFIGNTINALLKIFIQNYYNRKDNKFTAGDKTKVINVNDIFSVFTRNLNSKKIRWFVFREILLKNKLLSGTQNMGYNSEDAFKSFDDSLSVSISSVKTGEASVFFTTLAMKGKQTPLLAKVVNMIAEEARKSTLREVILNVKASIAVKIKILIQEIDWLQKIASMQRGDKIVRLTAADTVRALKYKIANIQKIEKNNRLNQITKIEKKLNFSRFSELRILQEQLNLLSINHKIEQLKKRLVDDSFIKLLRFKEFEINYLKSIQINLKDVLVARLERKAYSPGRLVKPNIKLNAMLGFLLGLFLSIFIAFFSNHLTTRLIK